MIPIHYNASVYAFMRFVPISSSHTGRESVD